MIDTLRLCTSPRMQPITQLITKVAATNTTVLLRGESGVGKELVARALHQASARTTKPFLKVNCAALPSDLLELELFGYERGPMPAGTRPRQGKFEAAHQGTLLLDGVAELPLRLQAKLLHVIQDGEFSRVGGDRIITADVRLVAATHRDLDAVIRARQFREDLYYRLNVIEIVIPPLRERREEIPPLVDHFLRKFNVQYGRSVSIPAETVRAFQDYDWPGNVRELENAVKRIVVLGGVRSAGIDLAGGPRWSRPAPVPATALAGDSAASGNFVGLKEIARRAARDAERVVIKETLDRVHWNRAKAARMLKISYKALLYKIVQCGLSPEPGKETEAVAS
jgi:two-component system, NtrC family, response regulator AtoC